MYEFNIENMSCGHCVSAVTKAIKSVDPDASASIDLNGKSARIETKLDPSIIGSAITEAGYPSSLKTL